MTSIKTATKSNDQTNDGQFKSTQRLSDDLLKENFRSSMADDSKNVKLSKQNAADCDKIKVNKTERVDSSGSNEPVKKKQKRPRDEKSGDSSSSLSSSVSITPIASLQSSVSASLSNTGLVLIQIIEAMIPVSN